MARSSVATSFRSTHQKAMVRHKYMWPEIPLIFWIIFMIITGLFLILRFADLASQQSRLSLGTPWIIPYSITVGALTEAFVWAMLFLSFQRRLVPNLVMLWTFILFVLYLTGFIETAIQLFGPVIKACRSQVDQNDQSGASVDTLVWLQQSTTCTDWYVGFAFWTAGMVMLVWMFFIARAVGIRRDY